jgi:sec-independent protein translocase protein TatA
MSIGFWQIVIVVLLLVLLFGRGKISDLMGDVAQGIKSFKKGLNDDDTEQAEESAESPKVIEHSKVEEVAAPAAKPAAKPKTPAKPRKTATASRAKTGSKRSAG